MELIFYKVYVITLSNQKVDIIIIISSKCNFGIKNNITYSIFIFFRMMLTVSCSILLTIHYKLKPYN